MKTTTIHLAVPKALTGKTAKVTFGALAFICTWGWGHDVGLAEGKAENHTPNVPIVVPQEVPRDWPKMPDLPAPTTTTVEPTATPSEMPINCYPKEGDMFNPCVTLDASEVTDLRGQ